MAKGGGDATPQQVFSSFSQEWEELCLKQNFSCSLILETSFHQKTFHIGPTVLALKLDKERVLRGVNHPFHRLFLTYFSNHEDGIQT